MALDLVDAAECRRRGSCKWAPMSAEVNPETLLGAWVAEMDFGASAPIRDVLHRAVDDALFGYLPGNLPEQVVAACRDYQADVFGWEVPAAGMGVAANVLTVMRAFIRDHTDPGAKILVPTPAYMPFLTIPGELGRECVQVPSRRTPGGSYALDLAAIEREFAAGAQMLILCNPWNPVGRALTRAELEALDAVLAKFPGALVFNDEIHSPLTLPGEFVPYASISPAAAARTVTSTAASKGWNVPGLHCAQWIVTDAALLERVGKTLRGLERGAGLLGCLAAVAAYRESREWVQEAVGQVQRNAHMVADWAASLGARGLAKVAVASVDGVDGADGTETETGEWNARVHLPTATYLSWWETDGKIWGENPAETLKAKGLIVNNGATLGAGLGTCFRLNLACSPQVLEQILTTLESALQ